jgi:hypothetical protein
VTQPALLPSESASRERRRISALVTRDRSEIGEIISSTVNSNYADSLGGQGGPLGTIRAEILYANDIDVFL